MTIVQVVRSRQFGESAVQKFDYSAPAELFPSRNHKLRPHVKYRRFDKAAHAIKFAMEELPEPHLLGAVIVLDEVRLSHKEIRELYESAHFPLKKPALRRRVG
jgi:hypothetical protein